jgi:hypothetical protein
MEVFVCLCNEVIVILYVVCAGWKMGDKIWIISFLPPTLSFSFILLHPLLWRSSH